MHEWLARIQTPANRSKPNERRPFGPVDPDLMYTPPSPRRSARRAIGSIHYILWIVTPAQFAYELTITFVNAMFRVYVVNVRVTGSTTDSSTIFTDLEL